MNQPLKFGLIIEDYQNVESKFEDFLIDEIGLTDWSTISYNRDWCRIDIHGVDDDNRITPEGYKLLETEHAVYDVVLHHKNNIDTYKSGWRVDRKIVNGKQVVNFIPDNDGWKNTDLTRYIIKEDL
jgi:hypothetical protein